MAEQIKINKKCINDPLYTPVERFLKERIKRLEVEGPEDELALAKERYTGLVAGDLVIENPVAFPDGITRVCFTARKTGFARVDVDITRVQMKDILEDFAVPMIEIEDLDNLKAYVKANKVDHALLWCKWLNNYGVLVSQEEAKTISGPMAAFGELFFSEYVTERESLTFIDYDTLESGTVKITDASFGTGTYPLFIYELVLDEANVPGITSNLPESITTQRGKDFSIPNTYWFNTTIDITHEAQIEISTGSGYTIPKRSEDGNFILGETIYGSAEKEVHDEIFVRVTYMWQNRPVKKTFTINVLIEKDNELDLTFEIDPPTVTAPSGSDVIVKIKAFYKGKEVKITAPPSQMLQQGNFGPLKFTGHDTDGSMIYEGHLSTNFPNTVEQVGGLYTAEFTYNEGDVTSKAPAYVNVILTRPETAPKFEIRSFPAVIRGYKNDKGLLTVGAFYNNEPISPTDLQIKTGVKGDKGLIEYNSVDQLGVNYTLIKDANKPGQEIQDVYDQRFAWIAPTGVRYTITRQVTVIVAQVSTVEVVPLYANPAEVKKYQYGGYPFKLLVNGADVTGGISGYQFEDPGEYITHKKGSDVQWIVTKTPGADEESIVTKVPFKFRYTVDGVWRDFTFEQNFRVLPWNPNIDEGGNTDTVAVPANVKIEGLSDSTGYFEFQVYHLAEDITDRAVVMKDKLVTPKGIRFDSFVYIPETNVIRANYTKLDPTTEPGKVYIQRPGVDDPKTGDIAIVSITTDVKQSRILVLSDYDKDTTVEVAGSPELAHITLMFAGKVVPLTDSNLSYSRLDKTDIRFVDIKDDGIEVVNNIWEYIGETRQSGVDLEYTYTDPIDGNKTKVRFTLPVFTVYPEMRLENAPATIDAAIWDTGTLPYNIIAGKTNWNSAVTSIKPIGTSKYIAFNVFNWEVIWAEKEATTITVPLEIKWTVGKTKDRKFLTEVTFNLAAWDQITFGGQLDTKSITKDSRVEGSITGNFVYKGKPADDDVVLDKAMSTIPETFIMGVSAPVENKGVVVGYTTTRGGKYLMTLIYRHVPSNLTMSFDIPTDIAWPHELNLVNITKSISGVWESEQTIDLVYNFDGIPLTLNDPKLKLTATSGTGEPVELVKVNDESLTIKLAKGGEQDTDYDYEFKIHVEYTDPTGKLWTNDNTVPVKIHIPGVKIGANPSFNVKVWERGIVGITLVDDQGRKVPIEKLTPRGTNPYITFTEPDNWYVTSGSQTNSITTTLRLSAQYSMGGNTYTLDTESTFTIAKYDGKKLVITEGPKELSGKAGTPGVMKFRFTYAGDPAKNLTVDLAKSTIPKNITLGEITPDGDLPYTLLGQATDTLTITFVRENATNPPVVNDDYVTTTVKVTTTSSDEVFTVESKTPAITIPWMETGTIVLALKYGEYPILGNTPGLKYSLVDNGKPHGIRIVGGTADGVIIQATRSNVSEALTVYPEDIKVTYEVGAPTPKEGTISSKVSIQMGKVGITNNDPIKGKIWDLGSFGQGIKMGDKVLSPIQGYKTTQPENEWIEFIAPRGWEIINAEKTPSTKTIGMQVLYKVDEVEEVQVLDFDASFEIQGSDDPTRFKCTVSPSNLEGAVDVESKLKVRPIYKGKQVGAAATFKPELSTFPKSLKYVSHSMAGVDFELVFEGVEAGLGEMELVFWSPAAGTDPAPRDVWKGKVPTKIMGELGVEIADRDNLLIGKDGDTGEYKLQILFGGIPIDAKQEIADGALKIMVEKGEGSSPNAGVLTVTDWNAESFNYSLKGVVAPGREVTVSDFMNITYTYGGNNFTRRVEIPEKYTSAPVAIVPVTPKACKMFETSQIGITSAKCGDLNLLTPSLPSPAESGWMNCELDEEQPNGYITVSVKNFTVVNADTTAKSLTLKMIYNGIYRNWTWKGEAEVVFNIAAWDQKTFIAHFMRGNPSQPIAGDRIALPLEMPMGEGSPLFEIQTVFKDKINFIDVDTIDYLDTDFKGALELTNSGPIGSNGNSDYRRRYYGQAVAPYEGEIKLILRVPNSPKPGVENLDWTVLYLDCKFVYKPLLVTGINNNLKGGNGDKGTLPLTVKLNDKNIPINDTNLKYTMVPDDIIKVTGSTTTGYTYEVIAPLDAELGKREIKFSLEYKDPATGFTHKGEFTQPFEIVKPADYPVITPIRVSVAPFNRVGGSTIFKITVSGVDVVSQCKPISITPVNSADEGVLVLAGDEANDNAWMWCTDYHIGNPPSAEIKTTWVIEVPFRGGTIQVPDVVLPTLVASSTSHAVWIQGTGAPNPFPLGDGYEDEIRFKITNRGLPTTKVTLDEAAGSYGPYFEVISVEPDGDEMVLKYKGKSSFFGKFNFFWKVEGYDGTNDTQQRGVVQLNAYQIPSIESVTDPLSLKIFQQFELPFKVMAGTTDITKLCTWTAVDTDYIEIFRPINTQLGPSGQVVKADTTEVKKEVIFTIQSPASHGNLTLTQKVNVIIAAWDQIEFWGIPTTGFVKQDDGLVVPLPFANTWNAVIVQAMLMNKSVPNKAGVSSSSDFLKITSSDPDAVTQVSQISDGNGVTSRIIPNKAGKFPGTMVLRYKGSAAEASAPNGYPAGTEGKNQSTIDVTWYVFEDKITFREGFEPKPLIIPNGSTAVIDVPFDAVWGLRQVMINSTAEVNFVGLSHDTGIASLFGQNNVTGTNRFNWDKDRYKIQPAKITVGESDVTSYYTFNIRWLNPVNNKTYSFSYDQPIIFKGKEGAKDPVLTVTDVQEVTTDVWKKQTGLPFKLAIDGVNYPIDTSTVTSVKVADVDKAWLEAGPKLTDGYRVIDGDPEASVKEGTFILTVVQGPRTWEIEQKVKFNISAYDGNSLRMNIRLPNSFNNGVAIPVNTNALIMLEGTFQGVALTNNYNKLSYWPAKSSQTQIEVYGQTFQQNYYQLSAKGILDSQDSEQATYCIGFKEKENDPNAKEGVDYVILTIPTYCYNPNRFYPVTWDPVIEGMAGTNLKYKWNFTLRRGIVASKLGSGTNAASSTDIKPAGVLNRTGFSENQLEYAFASEIDVATKETDMTIMIGNTSDFDTMAARFPVKAIQHTNVPFPTIKDPQTELTVHYNDSGAVPFKVDWKGTDVTDQISAVRISDNSYIEIKDKQWHVKHADPQTVKVMPTIEADIVLDSVTFTLKQQVTFTVLGYNGKQINVEAGFALLMVDEVGYLEIKGDYSGDPLSGNVIFDATNSDNGGIVTFGAYEFTTNESMVIKLTGKAPGEDGVRIRIKSVHDTGNGNIGSDYVDLYPKVTVLPKELTPAARFETTGEGNYWEPPVLGQAVMLGDKPLANTDSDLIIEILDYPDVTIKTLSSATVGYSFTNNSDTEIKHQFKQKFTYKGRSEYVVDITLTQLPSPTTPFVTDITQIDAEYGKSYLVPFKVISPR